MGRRPRPHHPGRTLAALLALALLSGCANISSQGSSGGGSSSGGSVSVQGSTGVGALLVLGILVGATYGPSGAGAPPMDPDRRIVEQDCTKPLQDTTANLRCK